MSGGLTWTDFFPDTPPGLISTLPTAIVVAGLYDTADLPELVALITTCSRSYSAAILAAKRKARRDLLAKQRKALLAVLAARRRSRAATAAVATTTAAFQALVNDLSAPGALSQWVAPQAPILPIEHSEDLN